MTRLYLFIFISCFCSVFYAQETVFPGDANANGIVDQYDLLSIGYAFGTTGPARIQTEDTQIQGVPLLWNEFFPNGTDYINADCDGNGVVDYLDFVPLFNNFSTNLDNASPLMIEEGILGIDPSVVWNNGVMEVAATGGTTIDVPISISLNDEQAINGLAFNLRYASTYFQSADFTNTEHWLATDDQAMSLIMTDAPDIMQIATTRFGVNPVSGGGNGGVLNLIIIADLIDYLEVSDDTLITKIYLEDILMVDENFNAIPIASDSFCLKLYHDITSRTTPSVKDELKTRVFPNPSNGQLHLSSQHHFNTIEIIDMMGRSKILYSGIARKQWESNDANLLPGLYRIKISGNKGVSLKKHIVL